MILEGILIMAIVVIFIVIARRLPEAFREGRTPTPPSAGAPKPAQPKTTLGGPTLGQRFAQWFGFGGTPPKPAQTVGSPVPANQPSTHVASRAEKLSEEALLEEGDAYFADGKLKEAERSFLRAVAKNPKNPKLYNRLGAIYLRQRNFSDALEAFEAARDLDASKASRHYNVALAAWQLSNRSKARSAISEAIRLDPDSVKYQQLRGQIES